MDKKSIRKMWADALRSGKYSWGKNVLHPSNGFCCFGVLCELAQEHGIIAGYAALNGLPSQEVADWVGLQTRSGHFDVGPSHRGPIELSAINDCATENPFGKIADMIEQEVPGLFTEEVA